jgi:hypothetical protein
MSDIDRAADFLWKVCRLNGFCFRRAEDIIYCYCLANKLDYPAAKDLIKKYDCFKPDKEPSAIPHITRTLTIRDLFENIQGMELNKFETLIRENKHNFLGYSKTAHEEMCRAYSAVKTEMARQREFDSGSAWLDAQVVEFKKDRAGNAHSEYRTANLSEIGELNIIEDDGSINKTIGDGDALTYSLMCRLLSERRTDEFATDVSYRDLSPNKVYCRYVTDLVSFLTGENLKNVIQKDERATEKERGCARKIFLFLRFAESVLKWERYLFDPEETHEPKRKTSGKPDERQELFDDFYVGMNAELDQCGYGYVYLANPFDWHIMNCVRLLDTAMDDTRGALIQFNEMLAQMGGEQDAEVNGDE